MKTFYQFLIENNQSLINQMAANLHNDWRKQHLQSGEHGQDSAVYKPRLRDSGLGDNSQIDITQHYDKLTPKWQEENKRAAETAINLVQDAMDKGMSIQDNLEELASEVHEAWMKRNPKADYNAAQHVPYQQLPEPEKQKDRDHIIMAANIIAKNK